MERRVKSGAGAGQDARTPHESELPAGVITCMFTDIEGSTRLLRATGKRYEQLLAAHNRIVRQAISRNGGVEVRMEGDSFFCVFVEAARAVATCLEAQRELCAREWPTGGKLRVRMGLHTGEARLVDGDYIGLAVHQAARVVDSGHGGQVLVSEATRTATGESLPPGASLKPLGAYRLKDFPTPTELYQLCHRSLPTEFPALRTLPAAAHNVPEQGTLFVDRRTEVVELAALVSAGRLVSILGPGGVGKTRLATEAVPLLVPSFSDGVWLIELASLRNGEAVALEVATALGVRAEAERSVVETLADALSGKRLLLVLDNCEHVLSAILDLVHGLLASCAGVHVLATSREPLGLREERRFALMPLAVPATADAVHGEDADAVALFADRAGAVMRTFNLERDRAAVVEICRRLDGLPLAIELAAARAASIPVGRIAARLDRRFSVLRQSYRGALRHHETLRASIDWSHDLLDPSERVLLRRLAVFAGEFDLEATEAICSRAPIGEDDILDLLARLVEKSLVQQSADRFVLLESIREFSLEQLKGAGEFDEVANTHLSYFTTLVEDAAREENGPNQRTAYDRLDAEFANIRAAVERALGRSDLAALRLGAALFHYGFVRNRLAVVAQWCIQAATAAPDAPAALTARALTQAGSALVVMGSAKRGHALVDDGLTLAHAADDPMLLAETLLTAADMRLEAGLPVEAQPLAQEALELLPIDADDWMRARALVIAARAGQHDVSYPETHDRMSRARALFERAGDRRQVARVLLTMAYVSLEAGELEAAGHEAAQCVSICQELQHPIGQAVARIVQVCVAIDREATENARALLARTVSTAKASGYRALIAYCAAAGALLCAAEGNASEATRILGAVHAAGDAFGGEGASAIRKRIEKLRPDLEAELGAERFASLTAEGAQLTLEEAAAVPLTS